MDRVSFIYREKKTKKKNEQKKKKKINNVVIKSIKLITNKKL